MKQGKRKRAESGGPYVPSALYPCPYGYQSLREDANHDAAILSASVLRVVRADGLVFAPADDVHLVQRHLMGLIEIALYRFGALFADALIHELVAGCVGVAFDLDEVAARVRLQVRDHLVDPLLDCLGQRGRAELELALIFADDYFI